MKKKARKLLVGDIQNIIAITPDYRLQKFIFSILLFGLNSKDAGREFRLPRKVIVKFDCCSHKSYREKVDFCEMVGLITKIREYYRQDKRARTYRVNYDYSHNGNPVSSLEEGLSMIPNLRALNPKYSRRVYKKIREASSHAPAKMHILQQV